MKHFRLCLILLCTVLFLTACGTAPKKGDTDLKTDETTLLTEPIESDESPAVTQKLILSLPATNEVEIMDQTRKIEVSDGGEINGVPTNTLRILSPEGEELWKTSYGTDGNTQCGIVTLRTQDDDPLQSGFIYWFVKIIPNESVTASYTTYALSENGKYERLAMILSSEGYTNLYGLEGRMTINIAQMFYYLEKRDEFRNFLGKLESKLYDGVVQFDTDGEQMQWEQWFLHEITFTVADEAEPTTLIIGGKIK